MKFLLINGRLRLANGRPVVMEPGVAGPGSGTLSLTLAEFYVAYAGVRPVIQRKAGSIYGDVPVFFEFTGEAPASVQARVMQGATEIKGWTLLESVSVAGNKMVGTLAGVRQGAGYKLEIRDSTQPNNTATTKQGVGLWGIGAMALAQGQSNMVGTLNGGFSSTVPGTSTNEVSNFNANKGSLWDTYGWHAASNGGTGPSGRMANTATANIARFVRQAAAALKAKYGYDVPVGLIPFAIGSQAISKFLPGGEHYIALFQGSGTSGSTIGLASPRDIYPGDFELVFWHQGEADQARSTADYLGDFTSLCQVYRTYVAQFGRGAEQLFIGAGVLGSYTPANCASIENIRKAILDSGLATWTTIDLRPGADGLHFNDYAVQKVSMARVVQAALKWLGCASFGGRGPRITTTTVQAASNVAVLTVEHEGGTGLLPVDSGLPITGFYANSAPDFTGSNIAVVATVSGPNQIALAFPSGTTYPVYAKHCGGRVGSTVVDAEGFTASCYPNTLNMLYDNASYPHDNLNATPALGAAEREARGLPLLPTAGAITVTGG